jgi:hypothetical protein
MKDETARVVFGHLPRSVERKARGTRDPQLNNELEGRVRRRTAISGCPAKNWAFTCSVSHDLRAPLRSGFTKILVENSALKFCWRSTIAPHEEGPPHGHAG